MAESMSWSGPWLKGVSMLRLTVTNWRLARICWPSSPIRKAKNSTAAYGRGARGGRRVGRGPWGRGAGERGGNPEPVERRPPRLRLLGQKPVDRERQRHLARRD